MSRIKDMTQGSPAKLLLAFTVPLVLGNLGQQFYMIVDAIIVGQGVGIKALAAVGAADWTYWLILWVVQALTQGFATRIAHHFGEGNRERIRKSVSMSVLLCLLIGIILTVVGLLIIHPVLTALKTPEDIFGGAQSYLFTMFSGTLIVMAYNMAAAILRAFGDGKTPLIAVGIAGGLNIVLDLLFVMGFHWGIVGAAAATLLAQLAAFLYCFVVVKKLELLQMQPGDWKTDPVMIKELCSMGIPLALQHVIIVVGGMVLQSTINSQGFLFVAGFTAANKLVGLMESSALSFGYATTTYMAQNYGAGLYGRIRKGMKSVILIVVLLSVIVSAIMLLGGEHILQLFISASDGDAPIVLRIAYRYLATMSFMLCALYLLHGCRSTIQGLGNAVCPVISGIVEFFMRASAAVLLTKIWGTAVIYFAEPLAWCGAALVVILGCIWKLRQLPKD